MRRIFLLGVLAAASMLINVVSGAAIGSLNIANCSGGGVTVDATTITFLPVGTVAGTGCINTGAGTNVGYSGGTLGPGVTGDIKDLTAGGGLVDMFMTFNGTPLDFMLAGLGPGSSNTNCAALTIGQTCSVAAGSPFILTNLGANTGVSLNAFGTVTDGAGSSEWFGAFTTQLNQTTGQIQATILGGGSITSTHSAQFTVSTVPEPTATAMFLIGGLLITAAARKRKSRA